MSVLGMMLIWENIAPFRILRVSKLKRWPNNIGLAVLDTLLLRLLFPLAAVGFAEIAQQNAWGFFNQKPIPNWIAITLSIIVLDCVIYLQHVAFHRIPILWHTHRAHHTDLDLDATTGIRFHPIEIVLSMSLKIVAVVSLGAPTVAVLIFEILLNATTIFNHSNIQLPFSLDKILRSFLVTPDMHRIHHSIISDETNSNFGFNLPWWDYLCRTYRPEPIKGQDEIILGLEDWQTDKVEELPWILANPFIQKIPLSKE